MNKPLQVFIDESDLQRLDEWARSRGWTKSRAVRAAIRALTRPRDQDPLLDLIGMFDGLPTDLSENFDRYLNETYVSEKGSQYRSRRKSSPVRVRR